MPPLPNLQGASAVAAQSALAQSLVAVLQPAAVALEVAATRGAALTDQNLPLQPPGPPSPLPAPAVESAGAVVAQAAESVVAEGEAGVCAGAHRLPLGPGVAAGAQTLRDI